jgi:hypothetical protein
LTLALTAARLGILEEVEVVVCISVVAPVPTSTVESSLASPLFLLMLLFLHHGHPQSAPGEVNLYKLICCCSDFLNKKLERAIEKKRKNAIKWE